MTTKTTTREYGGIQFVMVNGLKDGEGIARIGTYDINPKEVISDSQIIKSNLAEGLEAPTVSANGHFILTTRETGFGYKSSKSNADNDTSSTPTAKIVSEKAIYGVQEETPSKKTSGNPEAKIVSVKEILPIQVPIGESPN